MKYFFLILYSFTLVIFTISIINIFDKSLYNKSNISAYYNSSGAFAGFIQTDRGLIRACEFSTNGTILSCSKWFDKELLKQGQNEGLSLEDI